ncbi:MAG: CHAT domain-containing protein [Cyanobacteriota bacterium]|nr:CHAT domain-containing protein [Cyanobacteriota bacterium]
MQPYRHRDRTAWIRGKFSTLHVWIASFAIGLLFVLGWGLWVPAVGVSPEWLGHRLEQAVSVVESASESAGEPSLMQQGLERYHAGDWQGAIELWESALAEAPDDAVELLKYLARAYQKVGRIDRAITYFERAIASYRQAGEFAQVGRILTEQAQAYSSLGQHQRAIAILCAESADLDCQPDSAIGLARGSEDKLGMAAALGSLGNTYGLQGKYPRAIEYLEASLAVARDAGAQHYILAALNSLGNVYGGLAKRDYRYAQFARQAADDAALQTFQDNARNYDRLAVEYFEEAIDLAVTLDDGFARVRSQLNSILPLLRSQTAQTSVQASQILDRARVTLDSLPDSREKAYATIKLASFLQRVRAPDSLVEGIPLSQCLDAAIPSEEITLLEKAVSIARHIRDRQAESFALGRLGHVYECRQEPEIALNLTHQAQLYAITPDSLYLWEWQAGRLLAQIGKPLEAIEAYERSVATLKGIRGDMARAGREFQLDFRDTVEPVYRELTQLRLERADRASAEAEVQANLEAAVNALDELRLAELQDYLGDECEILDRDRGTLPLDRHTALLSSVIFADRIAVILTRPDGEEGFRWQLHWVRVNRQEAIEIVNDFRFKLEKRSDLAHRYRDRAQELYDWLIRPFAEDLAAAEITTLVFLHDGILRSIPMAALYDGERFAIEQYAIGNTPTLSLDATEPLSSENLQILAFGLTQPSAIEPQIFFPPLENVQSEIEGLKQIVPGSTGLLDAEFTLARLERELNERAYPVLHLATHAQFGIDSRKTFLVTGEVNRENGQAYNKPLTLNRLYQLIQSTENRDRPLELLTLTACETAVGSDRDALGIAGVALQAGARSALATLWQVDDRTTAETIVRFYQYLRDGKSKAEALQATQKEWLSDRTSRRYRHPGYWAPFVSIGNWQ